MAKIIKTGELDEQAIPLRHLHSREILYLDDELDTTVAGRHPNGGFAEFFLEWRNGIIGLIRFIKTSKPENRETDKLNTE